MFSKTFQVFRTIIPEISRKYVHIGSVALLAASTADAAADPLRMRIYDGDTVAPTVRLTIDADESFDTPEPSYRWGAVFDR